MIKEDDPSAPLTREALYALVWSEPMLKVAVRSRCRNGKASASSAFQDAEAQIEAPDGTPVPTFFDRWGRANRIEQFFRDAEQRAAGLSDDERFRLLERLKLAREMVGSVDALDRFMAWKAPKER